MLWKRMINLCNHTGVWGPISSSLLVGGGVIQAPTSIGQHALTPVCLRWQMPHKTTSSKQAQSWSGGCVKSHEQHLPFVETWHQQVLHFICPSLFWKLVRSAVSTPNMCWQGGTFLWKDSEEGKTRCSVPQKKLIVKPSLLYQCMLLLHCLCFISMFTWQASW